MKPSQNRALFPLFPAFSRFFPLFPAFSRFFPLFSAFFIALAGAPSLFAGPIQTAGDPLPSAGSLAGVPSGVVLQSGDIVAPPPEPQAVGVSTTIEGINFDQGAANSGFYNIPPDPIGAAGPNHVVSVVNTSIEWHTKAGVQQLSQKLGTASGGFFNPLSPVNGTFDPKVIYDQHAGRFVVVTLERNDSGAASPSAANTSRILVAVSDDSDPNGTWHFMAINSKITIGGLEHWADYPGLAVDEEAIYITNNMFRFSANGGNYGGTRLWIINKSPLYTGGTGTFTVHDPFAGGGVEVTLQPAHILGTPPVGNTGTFLVGYSGLNTGVTEVLEIVRVDNPLTAPSFSQQYVNVGNIDSNGAYPNAPQSVTANLVWTNDRRAINAVWRDNRLYTAASTMPASGTNVGQVTARFWELNTTTLAAITQVQSGEIGGEDIAAGAYTFFPSIAVNALGDICVGFSASAPTIFPGAYAVVHRAGDAAGSVRPALTVAAGQDYYTRTFGSGRNRWGDYSGTCVDPSNDTDFWIFNEYAMTRGTSFGGEDGRWATRWAKIEFGYDSWAAGPFPSMLPLSDPSADVDYDGGGLETGIEWVVGGDPTDGSDDVGNAPTIAEDGTYLVFTYNRRDEANDDVDTSIKVEYGSDLTGWATATHGVAGVIINETPGSPADVVEVKIPMSLAVDDKLFARLKVQVTLP